MYALVLIAVMSSSQNTFESAVPFLLSSPPPMRIMSPVDARRALEPRLNRQELLQLRIPYEATPVIRDKALGLVQGSYSDREKLQALLVHFRHQGYLERYDRDGTRTAQEVFETGQGNCLSYANLFIAMARSVGLTAYYLDASDIVSENGLTGSVLVHYGHVLAGVQIGPELTAIEFDGRAGSPKRFRPVSDLEAIADFYNNLGFEASWLNPAQGLASSEAIKSFALATRIAPWFGRAWNNLGVALARAGKDEPALRAYQRAARMDGGFAAPHANLALIHLRRGHVDLAIACITQAVALEPRNPHYHFFLARIQTGRAELDAARQEVERAIALKSDVFLFHLLRTEILCAQGAPLEAAEAARRVFELSPHQRDASLFLRAIEAGESAEAACAKLPRRARSAAPAASAESAAD